MNIALRSHRVLGVIALSWFLGSTSARAQDAQVRVTGTVTSAADGTVLPGARVSVKNTALVTLSGTNGRFAIDAQTPNDTLVFAFIGFKSLEIPLAGRSVVNAALEAAAIQMQEVVITGYGSQQKRDVTGSMSSIKAEDLPPIASPSVDQLLQGQVAGVQVTPSSGRPSDPAVVRIRGIGTLNDASPLYVVDGMLVNDVSFINPSDVASMEVLKDASATAIYGSRGANGVIIITTKGGTLDHATRFSEHAYTGMQSILHPISLVNAQQYAVLANQLRFNAGDTTLVFANPGAIGAGTDWQAAIFKTAPTQNYEVSAAGGSQKNTYYFSGNYVRQPGVLPGSDFNRATLRVNNTYQLTDHIAFGHNLAVSYTDDQRPPGVLNAIYHADPTVAPTNSAGAFNDATVRSSAGNPAAAVFYTRNVEHREHLVGNVYTEANLLGHVTLRSSFGVDYDPLEYKSFVPTFFVSPTQQNLTSNLLVQQNTTNSWLWENTLTYNYASERQRLNLLAGVTAQSFGLDSLGCARQDIVGDSQNFWYCDAGAATGQTNFNGGFAWKMLSYLFRTNYALHDRYLLTASLRIDGSSRFGPNNRYGSFPSFALGWNVKQATSETETGTISALKVRASWGEIGNDKISAYAGIPLVTGNLNTVFGPSHALYYGATAIDLANPDIKWERTTQSNLGTDGVYFGGRLEATLDAYRRVTDGILVSVPIPSYVGAQSAAVVNAAKVRNSGFEGSFTWHGRAGGLQYQLSLNGATISNKVLGLGQGNKQILSGGLGNEITYTTRTVVGQPIGCFWGYHVVGVFQDSAQLMSAPHLAGEQPGDLRFADTNGQDSLGHLTGKPDGQLTSADQTFLGCPIPDVVYGFGTRLKWGNFDLSASFSGQAGNKVYNGKKAVRFGIDNFESSYLDAWTPAHPSNSEPRVTNAGVNYLASDRFIENGSFLKLQSLQLGFLLPRGVGRHVGADQARVYVNVTNVFDITSYTGYTPEVVASSVIANGIDLGVFPPARTITAGLDLTF